MLADASISLPVWIEVVVGAGALVTALGILWTKVFRPIVRFAAVAERMWPLGKQMVDTMADTPDVFSILDQIARQFRTDSGSSMRDVVNRLEQAANANAAAIASLKIADETSRQLAERDRNDLQKLLIQLAQIAASGQRIEDSGARIEVSRAEVASDLAATQHRADDVRTTDPGAAADAASKSPKP